MRTTNTKYKNSIVIYFVSKQNSQHSQLGKRCIGKTIVDIVAFTLAKSRNSYLTAAVLFM